VPSGLDPDGVAAARRALGCGDLADLLEATTEPLDVASFLRNVLASPRLTAFRFDPDPIVAEAELCE
jgi:arabinofuranosyltransferase